MHKFIRSDFSELENQLKEILAEFQLYKCSSKNCELQESSYHSKSLLTG